MTTKIAADGEVFSIAVLTHISKALDKLLEMTAEANDGMRASEDDTRFVVQVITPPPAFEAGQELITNEVIEKWIKEERPAKTTKDIFCLSRRSPEKREDSIPEKNYVVVRAGNIEDARDRVVKIFGDERWLEDEFAKCESVAIDGDTEILWVF